MKRTRSIELTLPLLAGAVAMTSATGVQPAMAQRQAPIKQKVAQRAPLNSERVVVPADTVVRVKLDETVNSRNVRIGDKFQATLADSDRSGFPDGTRFDGSVTEVQRSTEDRPGVLDMRFTRATLPGGRSVALDGRLASLANDDIRRGANGRLETRRRSGGDRFDPKWVGYGAAGGAVLAEILGSNFLKGALLGGLGGAVYGYLNRDRDRRDFRDVTVDRGTEFGIRMSQRVAFNEEPSYRYASRNDRYYDRVNDRPIDRVNDRVNDRLIDRTRTGNDRVAGTRNEYRFAGTGVFLDNRTVELQGLRPMNVNGQLYVPLAPIAESAGWKLRHRAGDDYFSLTTAGGKQAEGYAGEHSVTTGANQSERLEDAPILVDGDVFVPTEFLNRVGELRVNWNRTGQRLELQTYR